jgi:hypothetical protein
MTVLMKKPFSDVENNSFRELLLANRNYSVPSRGRLDVEAVSVKEELRNDLGMTCNIPNLFPKLVTMLLGENRDAQKTKNVVHPLEYNK